MRRALQIYFPPARASRAEKKVLPTEFKQLGVFTTLWRRLCYEEGKTQHSYVEPIVQTAYLTAQLVLALGTLVIISRALIERLQGIGLLTDGQTD